MANSDEIQKTSWLGSYVNLGNTLLGAGILGLPYALANTGWVLGIFMLLICLCFSATGLHLLTLIAVRTKDGSKQTSFYTIARTAHPLLPMIVDIAVLLKCFGVASSYLIIISDLMPTACDQMGCVSGAKDRDTWVLIGFLIAAPFCLNHSLDHLKYTSALCLIFLVFTTFVVFLYSLSDDGEGTGLNPCRGQAFDDDEPCVGGQDVGSAGGRNFAKVFSIYIFAYTCHQNIFPIVNELETPSQYKFDTVILMVMASALSLYLVMGMCGYATYGNEVRSDIIVNYPVNGLMSCVRVLISFVVCFSYPLQVNPGRRCTLTLIDTIQAIAMPDAIGTMPRGVTAISLPDRVQIIQDRDEVTCWMTIPSDKTFGIGEISLTGKAVKYYATTVVLLLMTFITALAVTDLGLVLELIGATGSTLICYVLPGLLYLIVFDPDRPEAVPRDRKDSIDVPQSNAYAGNPMHSDPQDIEIEDASVPVNSSTLPGSHSDPMDARRGMALGPSPQSFWPTDPEKLRLIARVQLSLGCCIIPLSLAFIISSA